MRKLIDRWKKNNYSNESELDLEPKIKCQRCGKMWSGVEMYYCSDLDCPVQKKVVF